MEETASAFHKAEEHADESLTLVSAIARLPSDPERGFRFIGFGPQERAFSWDELRREAGKRAAHLAGSGLSPGDRLALVISDGPEFVLSFVAAVMAGIVPVPVFPPATARAIEQYGDTLTRILEVADASVVLSSGPTAAILESLLAGKGAARQVWTVETVFAGEPPPFTPPRVSPSDLCFLQFTSGSTSSPRGVMVTHANLVANARAYLGPHGLDCRPADVGVSWLPLFHDMGLIGFVLTPLIGDVPVSIISTGAFGRDPRIWLREIHRRRASITYAPNFAYAHVTRRVREEDLKTLDLSCLRVAGCGAEPIHAPTLRAFAERFAPAGFQADALLPSYGLAESTLAVSFHRRGTGMHTDRVDPEALKRGESVAVPPGFPSPAELVCCGTAFPGHEIAVFDERGRLELARRVGEIALKGPSVTSGYFNAPEATAESWRDGWFFTGDLGYLESGELHVCGRRKDLIIVRGANYHPQDIEWAVRDLPGVRRGNVAAFSIREVGGLERLALIAEADPRDAADLPGAIALRIRESVGLDPDFVAVVSSGALPRTSSGKLQRARARQLLLAGAMTVLAG
ncbi:MAG: fatty acyl-AMP ligase, partial [Acidobacteriota bacterium]|nr:fatty acyl-AMP ligase [Acidobacteriota bacterium]